MYLKMDKNSLKGLLDNSAGIIVAYEAAKKTDTPIFFTNYEELDYDGAIEVAKKLANDTLVIVIDTILKSNVDQKIASITNAYNVDLKPLKDKLADKIHFIDGFFEEKEDETCIYGKKFNLKTFYFGVPIPKDYHLTNNQISLKELDKVTEVLVELISTLKKD